MYWMYVCECSDGSLYCGIAKDPLKRLLAHNKGTGAKYTRSRRPVRLVKTWSHPDKSSALKAEARFKKLTRKRKLQFIEGGSDD